MPAGVSQLSVFTILKVAVETTEQMHHGLQAGFAKKHKYALRFGSEKCVLDRNLQVGVKYVCHEHVFFVSFYIFLFFLLGSHLPVPQLMHALSI